jgi:PAS domain S-box-containing protein
LRRLNRALEEQTAVLESREELLKTFVQNVPAGVAMLDREMRYLQVSDRWCADYSMDASQLGRSHYELFPDIPPHWREMHSRALAGETLRADEDCWRRKDGDMWVRWELRPWRTANGDVGGMLIFAEDITERKKMQDALSAVSGKLLEAHEQERRRISRELHDDILQRLALYSATARPLVSGSGETTG